MNYKDYVCNCIGLQGTCEYLDDIQENFGVDGVNEEFISIAINNDFGNLSNRIAQRLYEQVISKAQKELDADEEKFDMYVNGSLDTYLTYNGEKVNNWDEIIQEVNKDKADGTIKRYNQLKEKYHDFVLLIQDASVDYVAYQDDSEVISHVLNIPISTDENGVKTASFSFNKLNYYLTKIIRAGYKVAICDKLN